jgi:hypothetical protein
MDVRRFIRRLGFYGECKSQCTDVDLPAFKKSWALLIIFFNLQKTLPWKTSCTDHVFMKEEKGKVITQTLKVV